MVNVRVEVIYPEWQPDPQASDDLVAEWEAFTTALREHEGGHVQIAINETYALQDELDRLASELSCAEFASALSEARQRAWDASETYYTAMADFYSK